MVGDQWENFALLSAILLPLSVFIAPATRARYNGRDFKTFLKLIPTESARRQVFPQSKVNATNSRRLSMRTATRTLLKVQLGSP